MIIGLSKVIWNCEYTAAAASSLLAYFRAATNLENLEKSGNLKVVREKSGKVEKVRENVFCLWCVTTIVMVTESA